MGDVIVAGQHQQRSPTRAAVATERRHKTRFVTLTPAPASFRNIGGGGGEEAAGEGDTRARAAVAHARKTWAPPALRTQAVASYGAVPDLEVGGYPGGPWGGEGFVVECWGVFVA